MREYMKQHSEKHLANSKTSLPTSLSALYALKILFSKKCTEIATLSNLFHLWTSCAAC